jgi:hypothetical protein
MLPNLTHELPVGADTPIYVKQMNMMLHGEGIERTFNRMPMFYILAFPFAFLFGPMSIPYIFIPLISMLTLIPIFFLVRKKYGEQIAFISTALLSVGLIQLRFVNDVYRNVVGNLFLFSSFYFLFYRKRIYLIASLLFLYLSHNLVTFVFFLVTIPYLLYKRDVELGKTFITSVIVSLLIFALIGHITGTSIVPSGFETIQKYTGHITVSEIRMHVNAQVLFWLLPFILFSLPLMKKNLFFIIFLLAVAIVTVLAMPFWVDSDRLLVYAEFPLAIFAAKTLRNKKYFFVILLALLTIDAYFFSTTLLSVNTPAWKNILPLT